MNHRQLLCALLVATPTAFAATPPDADPAAASRLNPVTVSASMAPPPLRLDVRAGCPEIDAALRRSLAFAWGRLQQDATMQVQFRLDRGQVTQVRADGSGWDYRPFVRRAVRQLNCPAAGDATQEFAFILDFGA